MRAVWPTLLLVLGTCYDVAASEPSFDASKAVMIEAPRPDRAQLLRHQGVKGAGVFRLHLDRVSGRVRSVEIRRSTGSPFLDRLSIETLSKWRAKPGAVPPALDVPITYSGTYQ